MRTLIRNIGQVVTGDVANPLGDADEILIEDGRFAAIGRDLSSGPAAHVDQVIDAQGTTAIPGLIDSHAHPVFGECPALRAEGLQRRVRVAALDDLGALSDRVRARRAA